MDATGNTYADGTLGVKGVSTLQDDLLLSEDAAVIKHSVAAGSTTGRGCRFSSENYHVDVESVRFTDASIGTTTDADLITLADDSVSIKGTLDTMGISKSRRTKFTVDAHGQHIRRWHHHGDGRRGHEQHPECQAGRDLAE